MIEKNKPRVIEVSFLNTFLLMHDSINGFPKITDVLDNLHFQSKPIKLQKL